MVSMIMFMWMVGFVLCVVYINKVVDWKYQFAIVQMI